MQNHLYILWTNADPITSELMVMMYARNSLLNHWWKQVTVIIWGATAGLAAENEKIREQIAVARQVGVEFSACMACADQLGVTEKLQKQGIEVVYWGEGLSRILHVKENLITV